MSANVDIAPRFTKTFFMENPLTGDKDPSFYTPEPLTVSEIRGVIQPQVPPGSPSVTWQVFFAANRQAAGTAINTAAQVTTNTTTGDPATIVNAAIPAGSFVWLSLTTVTTLLNAPKSFSVTLTARAS